VCAACTALDIPCYGFGARPAWLDGGDGRLEREKMEEIRRRVKRSVDAGRRGRALKALSRSRGVKVGGVLGVEALMEGSQLGRGVEIGGLLVGGPKEEMLGSAAVGTEWEGRGRGEALCLDGAAAGESSLYALHP
jgi:hypothetical protein